MGTVGGKNHSACKKILFPQKYFLSHFFQQVLHYSIHISEETALKRTNIAHLRPPGGQSESLGTDDDGSYMVVFLSDGGDVCTLFLVTYWRIYGWQTRGTTSQSVSLDRDGVIWWEDVIWSRTRALPGKVQRKRAGTLTRWLNLALCGPKLIWWDYFNISTVWNSVWFYPEVHEMFLISTDFNGWALLLIDRSFHWLIACLVDWSLAWLIDWLIDWLIYGSMSAWLNNWLIDWLICILCGIFALFAKFGLFSC